MPQGGFLEPIKLGPAGAELELSVVNWAHPTGSFTQLPRTLASVVQVADGQRRRSVHAQYDPAFRVMIEAGSHKVRDAVAAMYACFHRELAFVYADEWLIPSEYYKLTEAADHFYMRTNPYQRLDALYNSLSLGQILVQSTMGVYDTLDLFGTPARGAGNIFSSYSRSDGKVTLTSTKPAGTELYFDYRYKGCTVVFSGVPQEVTGRGFILGTRQWVIQLPLEAA